MRMQQIDTDRLLSHAIMWVSEFLHLLRMVIEKPCKAMWNVVYENRTPFPQPERILIENLTPELPGNLE